MRDCVDEFPADWFKKAKFAPSTTRQPSPDFNFFGVLASQSLSVWQKNKWIYPTIPAAGSSGIADITWAGVISTMTSDPNDEGNLNGTVRKTESQLSLKEISPAVPVIGQALAALGV